MGRVTQMSIILILISSSFITISFNNSIASTTINLNVTSCFINDLSDTTAFNAIQSDGGTSLKLNKNQHVDAPFQKLNGIGTILSATLYIDCWCSLSGTWSIYLKDGRDGNTIAYVDPAPEFNSENRYALNCNSITKTELNNGVWLYVFNNDDKGPEVVNLDFIYLSVVYEPSSLNSPPSIYLTAPEDQYQTNDSTPRHIFYFIDLDNQQTNCTLYYNGVIKGTYLNGQNNTIINITASETPDGTYTWWVNCSDGVNLVKSEERTIIINTSTSADYEKAYYRPNSDLENGWNDGDGVSYTSLDENIIQPIQPITNSDYIASRAGDNSISEFGFTNITQNPNYITLWIYTTTESNAEYSFYLQQDNYSHAVKHVPTKSDVAWQSCTWLAPTGDLSKITVEIGGCIKNGSGKPKNGYIYAVYLEVGYSIPTQNSAPDIFLLDPENNTYTNFYNVNHTFYILDNENLTTECSLFYDGQLKSMNSNVYNNTITTLSALNLEEGIHTWWINCSDGEYIIQSENRTINIDTQAPVTIFNTDTDVNGTKTKEWIFINITTIDPGVAEIEWVILEWNGVNESFDNTDGISYWENKTGLLVGNYTFRVFVKDTAGNLGQTAVRWVNLTQPAPPVINIEYPVNNEYLFWGEPSVRVFITTDCNALCQYDFQDFVYGNGINFTDGQRTQNHSFVLNITCGEVYTLYYRSMNIDNNISNTASTLHTFGVYGCEILSNYVRISASEGYDTSINAHPMFLLDNIPTTNYTTSTSKVWSDTTTLSLTFSLPNKNGYSMENYSVSHFRFRCYDLDRAPNKYDIYTDNVKILENGRITPQEPDKWVMIDLTDTNITYIGGTFKWVIKGVQGGGSQKIGISDIEIFSTTKLNYQIQTPQPGYLGITRWWNNLQWAYSLHIDDVDDADYTVDKFGMIMPLTLQMWREYTPDFGNEHSIINSGHEYGTHGYTHTQTGAYTYSQGYSWALNSKQFVESNVVNTTRWGDTLLSLAYPFSDSNFHVAEAVYDVGFRVSGQITSQAGTGVTTGWRGWQGGVKTTRDEMDWMHIHRSLGGVMSTSAIFNDGTFEKLWNWTRDNGLFGDSMLHQYETLHNTYINHVQNENVGWQCTWGEARSYYYHLQHTFLNFNSSNSNDTTKVYNVKIDYESSQDKDRFWHLPVTFAFNLTNLGLNQNGVISYLENNLHLNDITGNQRMTEGYFLKDDILYLSKIVRDNSQIIITEFN